ncbi:hypothetical protein IPF89_02535 [Candidatus Saccharibacteria bacterium]|nr:MAG: hypothetical protein IPF89_02535 [Candidatus Saccharibacteria bacterium]
MAVKKRRSLRLPQKFLPSENIWFALCATKEKRRNAPLIPIFYQFWCPCTTRLEPILSKTVENCKAAGSARPARKTILCIFEFYPAEFLLLL